MARRRKLWIQESIKRPGALKKTLGVEEGKKIPAGKLMAASRKTGRVGRQARLAMTLKKFKKK